MFLFQRLLQAVLLLLAVPVAAQPSTQPIAPTIAPDTLRACARHIAAARGLPEADVSALLQDARINARVAQLIAATSGRQTPRAWPLYRQRFVEPIRIRAGVAFWRAQQAALGEAQARYGVPAAVIVAILGVETLYGKQTGSFRVLDTLATLAFDYPEPQRADRVQLFRDQLADLIELHSAGRIDAMTVHGSFAGAIGVPQFMPGSVKRYAVDGDGDGRIDLHASVADIVMSVANFLREHGWLPGLPVFAPVLLPEHPAALVTGGLTATHDWPQLRATGARVIKTAMGETAMGDTRWQRVPLGVIDLVDARTELVQTEYRTATPNFFALTTPLNPAKPR